MKRRLEVLGALHLQIAQQLVEHGQILGAERQVRRYDVLTRKGVRVRHVDGEEGHLVGAQCVRGCDEKRELPVVGALQGDTHAHRRSQRATARMPSQTLSNASTPRMAA